MRGKRIHWTGEQRAYAAAQYSEGLKSTRDLASEFGVSFQSVAAMLRAAGVTLNASDHIKRKAIGRLPARKGKKASAATIEKMRVASAGRKTTLGKRYTEAERANITAGLARHYARLRDTGLLLSEVEKAVRAKVRYTYKRLVRRLIRAKAGARSEQILGYTATEFRSHIEQQFRSGMSWSDRASFHVDHIVPVAEFLRRGVTDPRIVCALSNLQPLPPLENQSKGATYTQGIAA